MRRLNEHVAAPAPGFGRASPIRGGWDAPRRAGDQTLPAHALDLSTREGGRA